MAVDPELDAVIEQFTSTEEALRHIAQSAEQLRKSSAALDDARNNLAKADSAHAETVESTRAAFAATLEEVRTRLAESLEMAEGQMAQTTMDSRQRLEEAERHVRDTASAIYELTVQLRDAARDLGDTAVAFRELRPGELKEAFEMVKQQQRIATIAAWCAAAFGAIAVIAAVVL